MDAAPSLTADLAVARDREATGFGVARFVAVGVVAALALASPLWLLLLTPLFLGVPHVAQDVRLLWLRLPGGLPRGVMLCAGIPLFLLVVRRALHVAEMPLSNFGGIRFEIGIGLCALFGAALATPSTPGRRAFVLAALSVLASLALAWPSKAQLLFGHLHNLVALLLLVALGARAGSRASRFGFLATCLIGAAIVASDPAVEFARASALDQWVPAAFHWSSLESALAPGLAPELATRLVLVFAFAQALHYAVWLSWLPSVTRPATTLRGDLGPTLTFGFTAIGVAVLVCACIDPIATRTGYLSLVLFHGWLELAVIVFLVSKRPSPPVAPPAATHAATHVATPAQT